MNKRSVITGIIVGAVLGAGLGLSALRGAQGAGEGTTETIKGEVVDLMCYLDHGAKGEKHKGCASKCIKSGGPVGLLTPDNQLYLVIGDHQPINDQLADKAAQTITLKGKVVERNGMKMIENAQVQD
ncbi:MAG TPA: hypothetical protein VMU04_16775 [Candidatus Acidoferrum sp.]|nr:hypothetical protein [Candidatus Acidoferrum sp.]